MSTSTDSFPLQRHIARIIVLATLAFLSRAVPAEEVTETQKILVLIAKVEALGNAAFHMGSASMTCTRAAQWMREDAALSGKAHPSAQAFVERVSGPLAEPYLIESGGKRLIVREFFLKILEDIDRKPPDAE